MANDVQASETVPLHSSYSNNEYTIGWVCALPIEMAAAKGMMDEEHGDPQTPPQLADQNTYILGCIGKFKVVVACLPKDEIGSSSAAVVARDMLHTFPKIRVGVLVGIGAGIPDYESDVIRDIRLGDVVISSDNENGGVVVYDFGKRLADGSFKSMYALDRPPRPLRTAISKLEAEHETRTNRIPHYINQMLEKYPHMRRRGFTYPGQLADQLFRADYRHMSGRTCAKCNPVERIDRESKTRPDTGPVIHYGVVATSCAVVMHGPTREEIRKKHRAICLEMEAAGLMNHFPCVVIRGIWNYADSHKNDQWQPYAAAAAAACAKELLEYVQSTALDGERTVKELLHQISKIGTDVATVRRVVDKKEDIEILNWLTPVDYGPQQSDYLKIRQPGTGQWFLDSAEYKAWLKMNKQTMFCQGMPGAGKTMLTAIVVDDLTTQVSSDPTIGVAYIYCNFQQQGTQKIDDLMASLLKQLAQGQSSLPRSVKDLYDRHKTKGTRPSLNEILGVLQSIAAMCSRAFIIVDALDECQVTNGGRARLLLELFSLSTQHGVNIFATSRFIPRIPDWFKAGISLEIRATTDDVARYIKGHIRQLPFFVQESQQLQEEISTRILEAVDGIFLLVQIYLGLLEDKLTPNDLRSALEVFQKQGQRSDKDQKAQVLAHAYKQTMDRIKGQKPGLKELAMKVLLWITCAKRPLTTSELQHALATKEGKSELDKGDLPDIRDMVAVCLGLVIIDKASGIIRLIHYTTQEYFQQTQEHWFPNAELDIMSTCVVYLSYNVFGNGFCETDELFEERLRTNQLYDYVTHYWGYYARKVSMSYQSMIEFLQDAAKVEASSQALMAIKSWSFDSGYSQKFPRQMTGLHVAAHFGVQEAVNALLRKYGPDLKDSYNRTPLSYATKNGHEAVAKLLLEKGADLETKDENGQTPLSYVAESGHEAVVKLLLKKGAELETKDENGQTPLSYAAENGHEAVVKLLLEKGAELDTKDENGQTPLFYAAVIGREAVVKFLLEKGAELEAKDENGQTPLLRAVVNGREAVAKLLLEKGAELETKDKDGWTPLSLAAANGHEAMVKLLLVKGAELETKDKYGQTPLLRAVANGHEAVVKLLK